MGADVQPATRRDTEAPPAFRAGTPAANGAAPARAALRVSSPQDNAERDAADAAQRVMQMPDRAEPTLLPRRPAPAVQRLALNTARVAETHVPADTAARIQAARTGGMPLPPPLRDFMEPRFGADFSAVRLHASAESAALSQALGARAFTAGAHIHFGAGEFKPDTPAGRELIAHELAHTLQQGASRRTQADGVVLPARAGLPEVQRDIVELAEHLYRMRDGRVIELPDDMTRAQATQLEADAAKAQQRLGRRPPPQPVPEVRKPADKTPGKPAKAEARPGRRRGAGGPPGPRSAGVRASLKAVGGKVAMYLVTKAAPVLARGISALSRLSRNEQTHDDAAKKVHQAEQAVVVPDSEGQSRGNSAQVSAVSARPAPSVDPAVAQAELQASLSDNVPRNIEDVDNFKRDMKAQHIGADVMKVVQGDKNAVVKTFADMERTPPAVPPEQPAVALPAPEVAPGTAQLNLGAGAVAPLLPEHTDTSRYTNEADAKLKEEGVTQDQLDMVDSGDLASANQEKKGLSAAAKSEPLAVKQLAQQQSTQVAQALQADEKKERHALSAKRQAGLGAAAQKQKGAKSALEKKRDEVAAKINGIFKTAQDKVKARLADLETQAMKRFDTGNAQATKAFEDDVARELEAFKDDRYSGWFGWARKAKDWLLGMDELPGVKAIFDRNRARFVRSIDRLVAEIAAENKRVIQECKDQLAAARQEIQTYVENLGPSLKDIGSKTAGEVNSQLDEMDGYIRKKEAELQQKLADKQQAAIKAIDDKIEKMKEAMAGALAKLGKLLLWAAKKFFTWALGKFGYSMSDIESIINRGAAVLKAIFTQPIAFVKNLMRAAILGFENFGKNFLTHLQDALFEWLTGSLQGLVLPKTWDAKGIVGVALQMIGISYQNLRRVMVEVMGEKAVLGLEAGFALVKTLVTEGPMAAWEQLKDMAKDMGDAFIAAVKDFIKWKIVEEAIKWVVSLFIPGAGIVKAIIGIYDTVVFFIQKAKQIAQMVGNFLGSIGEIAAGNIGAAAAAMESGLARGLSLVISFLAALLRLNGITAKIRDAIQKVRSKVDAALLKVVKWIAEKAKFIVGKAVGGAKKAVAAIKDWWRARKEFRNKRGETHALYVQGTESSPQLMLASDPVPLDVYLKSLPDSPEVRAAREIYERQVVAIFRRRGTNPEKLAQLTASLDKLSQALAVIDGVTPADLDKVIPLDQFPAAKPIEVKRARLTLRNKGAGSKPTLNTPAYKIIQRNRDKLAERWSQLHLINNARFGGRGTPENLVPGPESLNHSAQWTGFDNAMHRLLEQAPPQTPVPGLINVIWVKATVTYRTGRSNILDTDGATYIDWSYFAERVVLQGGLNAYDRASKTWNVETAARMTASVVVPRPDFDPSISLGTATRTVLERSGIAVFTHPVYGSDLRNFVRKNQPFASYDTLRKVLEEVVNDPRGNRPFRSITKADVQPIYAAIQAARAAKQLRL
jgi:hypothetical protein